MKHHQDQAAEEARQRAMAQTSPRGYVSSLHDGKPPELISYRDPRFPQTPRKA